MSQAVFGAKTRAVCRQSPSSSRLCRAVIRDSAAGRAPPAAGAKLADVERQPLEPRQATESSWKIGAERLRHIHECCKVLVLPTKRKNKHAPPAIRPHCEQIFNDFGGLFLHQQKPL